MKRPKKSTYLVPCCLRMVEWYHLFAYTFSALYTSLHTLFTLRAYA
jgi:hypothetical protein